MTRVAVVGATGAVGREVLRILAERDFPVRELRLFSSARSAGARIEAFGEDLAVKTPSAGCFRGIDVAFFSAGSAASLELAPQARDAGALVVDNSSAFRMDPACPLVVPEINGAELARHAGIIANPNCTTILLTMLLAPIQRRAGLRRVVVCSYQAVSGAGARAMAEFREQEAAETAGREPEAQVFPKILSHNVIPWVQGVGADGYTTEETKVQNETRRILGQAGLPVTATCVRVPVVRAHSEAIHLETAGPLSPEEACRALEEAEGVRVWREDFPTPREVAGTDEVCVGRVRGDRAFSPGLALWGVMDQLRKGAALNAVQIVEQALGLRQPA